MRPVLIVQTSLWAAILCGCLGPSTSTCEDLICPTGSVCAELRGERACVLAAQVEACRSLDDGEECSFEGTDQASCEQGVCVPIFCGNGKLDLGESCDDGNLDSGDGCAADCRSNESCGNGVVDAPSGESCDDGNLDSGDGCGPTCLGEYCGNGVVDPGEQCDDENALSGDQCSPVCLFELCGNEYLDPGEACDDGNASSNDGCSSVCGLEHGTWQRSQTQPEIAHDDALGIFSADEKHTVVYLASSVLPATKGGPVIYSATTWYFDGDWTLAPATSPPWRLDSAMVYADNFAGAVLYGGYGDLATLSDTWLLADGEWALKPLVPNPGARGEHGMAYDSTRQVTVLFGGWSEVEGKYTNDTWELDDTGWELASPTTSPPPLQEMAMGFDPVLERVVLIGRSDSATVETWEYDGVTWTPIATGSSPAVDYGMRIAYDSSHGGLVLYAGTTPELLWIYDGFDWAPLATGAPDPGGRQWHAMSFDEERQQLVVFGGRDEWYEPLIDTWELEGTTWTELERLALILMSPMQTWFPLLGRTVMLGSDGSELRTLILEERWSELETLSTPPAITGAALASYGAIDRVVLFGGSDLSESDLDQTWHFDGANWSLADPEVSPSARGQHAMTYDSDRGVLVLFGGMADEALADTWEYDGITWTQVEPSKAPPPRYGHTMTFDESRKAVVLVGGAGPGGVLGDVWEYDGDDWVEIQPASGGPAPRLHATLEYDPVRQRSVLVGGLHAPGSDWMHDDVWEWDGSAWTEVIPLQGYPARARNALSYDRGRRALVLFGGQREDWQSDTWVFRYSSDLAEELCSGGNDEDGDGLSDCDDPDCGFAPEC